MANIDIRMFLDNERLVQVPEAVLVQPGDTVTWTSDAGDLTVRFVKDNPFADCAQFVSAKGLPTNAATVRGDVPGSKHFECTVTIDGRVFEHWSGVDTPG